MKVFISRSHLRKYYVFTLDILQDIGFNSYFVSTQYENQYVKYIISKHLWGKTNILHFIYKLVRLSVIFVFNKKSALSVTLFKTWLKYSQTQYYIDDTHTHKTHIHTHKVKKKYKKNIVVFWYPNCTLVSLVCYIQDHKLRRLLINQLHSLYLVRSLIAKCSKYFFSVTCIVLCE